MNLPFVGDFHHSNELVLLGPVAARNVQRTLGHNFLGPYHDRFIGVLSSQIMDIIEIPTKPQSTTPDLTESVTPICPFTRGLQHFSIDHLTASPEPPRPFLPLLSSPGPASFLASLSSDPQGDGDSK